MRTIFFILFVFFTTYLSAQQDSNKILSSFDVLYGYRAFSGGFYDQLSTTDNIKLNGPIRLIGIARNGLYAVNRSHKVFGHFSYSQVIPENITVQDSIKSKITGFVFGFSYGWGFMTKSKKLGLFFYLGGNTGRLRMYGNELVRQKNPFFAPKVTLKPKFRIGRIAISLLGEAEYDISRPGWRRTAFATKEKINIRPFRQTCFTAQIAIGWLFK